MGLVYYIPTGMCDSPLKNTVLVPKGKGMDGRVDYVYMTIHFASGENSYSAGVV